MKQLLIIIVLLSISSLALGTIDMRNSSGRADDQASPPADKRTEHLLSIIRDKELRKTDPDRVAKAIVQLGQSKSVESVEDLAGLLAFSQSLNADRSDAERIQEIHPVAPSERYPAAGALIQSARPRCPHSSGLLKRTRLVLSRARMRSLRCR